MPLSSRILQKDPLAASRSPARMSHLGNAFSHVMKPFLAVLAFAALSLQAQTPIERQQEQLARQMAAQQQGQAVVTQQLNAENDRLLRNAAQQRLDSLAGQVRDAVAYGQGSAELALLQQQRGIQQTLLSSIDQRQNLTEQQLRNEIDRLRTNLDRANAAGLLSVYAVERRQQVIGRYQAELQRMRDERQENAGRRALAESQHANELGQAGQMEDARDLVAAAREQELNAISEAQSRELRAKAARDAESKAASSDAKKAKAGPNATSKVKPPDH